MIKFTKEDSKYNNLEDGINIWKNTNKDILEKKETNQNGIKMEKVK